MDWKELSDRKMNGTSASNATTKPSNKGGDWMSICDQKMEAQGFTKYTPEYTYKTQDEIWKEKYGGKSYTELRRTLSRMDPKGDEYKWLDAYSQSDDVMTAEDYKGLIRGKQAELESVKAGEHFDAISPEDYAKMLRMSEAEIDEFMAEDTRARQAYEDKLADYDAEIERLRAGQWRLENKEKYDALSKEKDFKAKSKATEDGRTAVIGANVFGGWVGAGDPVYDIINNLDAAGEAAKLKDSEHEKYTHLTNDERATYNYLYNTDGKKAAKEYLEYLEYDLDARSAKGMSDRYSDIADESPVLSSIASVPMNLASGGGYLDVAKQNAVKGIYEAVTGEYYKPINYNTAPMTNALGVTAIRGTVADNLAENTTIELDEKKHPVLSRLFNGKSLGDVYQLGMSMVDSATVALMSPIVGSAGTVLLGGAAATQGMLDAAANGATDGQALTVGLVNGTAEWAFEKIGVDNLVNKIIKGDKAGIVNALLSQGLAEGGEELGTSFVNTVADYLIMAEESGYSKAIEAYEDQGLDPEEAARRALQDIAIGMGWDFVGGMLTGGIMGGGGHIIGSGFENAEAKKRYGSQATELVNKTLEFDPENENVQKLQTKLEKGGTASGRELSKLVNTHDTAAIANAVERRLKELGETGEVKELSKVIAKQAAGARLNRAEQKAVAKSAYGKRVVDELKPENIRAGQETSEWAEAIGTKRINALEYSEIAKLKEQARAVDEYNKNHTPIAPRKIEQTEAASPAEIKPTGNDAVDTVINKAHSKELSGNDVRPILESPEAIKALEATVGSLNLAGKSSSEQRSIVREAVTSYAAAHPVNVAASAGTKAVPSSVESVASQYGKQAGAVRSIYNISPVENVDSFATAFETAYNIGLVGGYESAAVSAESTQVMSEAQRRLAYATGKAVRAAKQLENIKSGKRGSGVVRARGMRAEDINKRFKQGSNQKTALQVLRAIAEATGFTIEVFDSSGDYSMEQGSFDWDTDVIRIDIASGICKATDVEQLAKYAMLRTFCHEFTHVGEKWAAEEYNILRTSVLEALSGNEDFDLEYRIAEIQRLDYEAKKAQYIADGKTEAEAAELAEKNKLSWDMASREVVAEAMTDVLPESNFIRSLYEKSPSLAKRLGEALRRFLARVKEYYNGLVSNPSREAQALKVEIGGTVKYLEGIVEKWDAMALAAVENYKNAAEGMGYQDSLTPGEEGVVANENGEPVAHSTADGTIQLSMRTYEEEGREAFREYLDKCVSSKRLTAGEMQEMLDGIEEIYNVCKEFKDKYAPFGTWSEAAVVRDTHGRPVFSVVTPNGEYKMNLDFSLVCKKRRTLDAVFNEMSKRGIIDDFELGQKSVVKINEIIRKHGFETACALCFVDAKRFRQASMADQFVKLYNELVESLVPEDARDSISVFNFAGYSNRKPVADGVHTWDDSRLDFSHLDHVMATYGKGTVEHKAARYIKNNAEGRKLLLRGDFMSSGGFDAVKIQNKQILKLYNSKKGTGGPKAAFGDVQYMNEIIKKSKGWTPAKAYSVGGVRIQSFSDYVPRMVFDYVQMVYDLAATKLPAHAYTKETAFAKQFGLTGIKINMSLIPAVAKDGVAPGLDANGDYVWAGESFDFEAAREIQNAEGYTENCGTICVGVSDLHIRKLLGDPDIRMVIPYHKSGLNPVVAHMNKIAAFRDYTGEQNTLDKEGKKLAKDFDFSAALHKMGEKGDPKAVIENYLSWCDSNGYTPKFPQFRDHPNYYKLIEDFTLYDKDGNYVPQREVRAVFPKADSAFGSMKDLIQSGLEEDAVIEGKRNSELSVIVDEIEKSLPKTEAEIEEVEVEQADRDVEAAIATGKQFRLRSDNEMELENIKNGIKAIDKLISDAKNADNPNQLIVTNAMYRSDIGYIDFKWGEPGRGAKFKGGYGLSHIIAKRDSENSNGTETAYKIVEVIAKATHADVQGNDYTQPQNMRLRLFHDGYVAVFVRGENGNHWLLTGWENDKETVAYAVGEGYDSSNATAAKPTPTRLDGVNATVSSNEMIAFDKANSQEQFSDTSQVQNQRRTPSYTDREVLEMASDNMSKLKLTEGEKSALDIFNKRLDNLKGLEEQRDEQRQILADLNSAAKPNADEIRKTKNRLSVLGRKIKAAEAQVLSVEDKQVLKKVLHTARRVVETEQRNVTRENRNTTAMRHKIQKVVKELNTYLLKGTKDKHVMVDLQKAVASALDVVNMDTVSAEERIAKLEEELMKAKTPEKIQEISRRIDTVRAQGEKIKDKLSALKMAYAAIRNSEDPLVACAYDEVIETTIEAVAKSVGDTPLRNMSLEQLEEVYDLYKMVLTRVRDSNKAFKLNRKKTIDALASSVEEEVAEVGGNKKYGLKSFGKINSFLWNNFKPVYAFKAIGSKTLNGLFNNVRAGEDVWARDVSEARAFFLEQSKKYGYDSWDTKKTYTFKSTSGLEFNLTLEQMMSLYAYSKREQALSHLNYGGIVLEESFETRKVGKKFEITLKTEDASAYNISPELLAEIVGKLTQKQKSFADAMQDYLSTTMGEKGNEVSLEMYGVKLFKEKFYFPLKSATQYMAKAREQAKGEVKIKNSGFTKETTPEAKNPVVLKSFMDVWAEHVNDMSMYHAFTLPLEDFYRVYNRNSSFSDENKPATGVNSAIQKAYGKAATDYIEQLLRDLNGGARNDPTASIIDKMMGLFKKGATLASASVVIQQPSAIARATALVDSKYFIGKNMDSKRHKALWEEVKKYAPVAMIKEMGYFDTNMGKSTVDFIKAKEHKSNVDVLLKMDVAAAKENAADFVTDSGYRDEVLSRGAAIADEIGWCWIWDAVKRETADKHPALKIGSQEFLELAGARFTEVVVNTQVYDSVLSRSANMRSKDTGMKMATAFLAEPTTTINMIINALIQGKRGEVSLARKAIGAAVASQILNAILVSFVYAARDDDEDETYWEKYFSSVFAEVKDSFNLASYIPFVKDIVSIVQGYDVERSDISVIADIWQAYEQLSSDKISGWRKVENFVGGIAQLFGLPVKNLMRDTRALYQTLSIDVSKAEKTTAAGIKYATIEATTRKSVSNAQQIVESLEKGDSRHAERVMSRYEDEDDAFSAVRSYVHEQYRTGEVSKEKAQQMLADYADMNSTEVSKTINKWSAEVETGIAYDDIKQEYIDGNISKSDALQMRMEYGGYEKKNAEATVEEWTFEKKHGFAYRDREDAYADGEISRSNLITAIMDYKGMSKDEATHAVDYLEFKIKYPQYRKLSEEQFASYFYAIDRADGISIKEAGISIDVYAKYKLATQGIEGVDADGDGKNDRDSLKNQVIPFIDALPITDEQKDILFLQKWAKSGLWKTPWH